MLRQRTCELPRDLWEVVCLHGAPMHTVATVVRGMSLRYVAACKLQRHYRRHVARRLIKGDVVALYHFEKFLYVGTLVHNDLIDGVSVLRVLGKYTRGHHYMFWYHRNFPWRAIRLFSFGGSKAT